MSARPSPVLLARPRSEAVAFSLENVSFGIGSRTILHPLTLDLPAGRVVGLLGQNGSGKSTLLKMLARQQAPSAGTIRFETKPLGSWGDKAFARRVAYLPQDPPLGTGLAVRELVALGRYPWHGALGRFSATDKDKTEEAMALTGVDRFADRAVDTLSGGERQRVWIAMLVAQDAGCFLLDEPISALDVSHQIEILSLVSQLSHERGIGVVVVLHEVNMAARFCDEILALKNGRLVVSEAPERFMTAEQLRAVYDIEMAVLRHPGNGAPLGFAS